MGVLLLTFSRLELHQVFSSLCVMFFVHCTFPTQNFFGLGCEVIFQIYYCFQLATQPDLLHCVPLLNDFVFDNLLSVILCIIFHVCPESIQPCNNSYYNDSSWLFFRQSLYTQLVG